MEVLTSGTRGEISEEEARNPLPAKVLALRKRSFAVFVYNLSPRISKSELEAMFCRSGRIVYCIPADRSSGQKCGFTFMRFASKEEAARAVEEVNGRSWGRRSSKGIWQSLRQRTIPPPCQ